MAGVIHEKRKKENVDGEICDDREHQNNRTEKGRRISALLLVWQMDKKIFNITIAIIISTSSVIIIILATTKKKKATQGARMDRTKSADFGSTSNQQQQTFTAAATTIHSNRLKAVQQYRVLSSTSRQKTGVPGTPGISYHSSQPVYQVPVQA